MPSIETPYGPISHVLMQQLKAVKLLACDVDGVFSDGRIYMGQDGEELKAFHTKDGYGIKALQNIGVQVAIITGRSSNMVENRMTALGVKHILQGCEDKQPALQKLQAKLAIPVSATAAIGDDMPDVGMFNAANLSVCVQDGHPYVAQHADYVTQTKGGFGAVRELCDLILLANNQLKLIHGSSV
ncbi:3-deoxy-manno-octulosonate-8-phosphatase KdsC [Paraglaciecola aquimarina]|uniref:3-deoxy-D-manno-octulosonate 8-phosphate phosphatase KdsC n=1 Tax=Paraglaciecola aquimarina TaxID=1235557 RepID=A0ABU3SS44_9ALTE|nr:3-deoxy-manno-octulosonate-8-phosphatase KdsC [Paraglaciecola aquimarina]MDU0352828.1 3-deoxy-manno-octulosonate-8-phosphatase KdsC [Paraglaciecola aquimarina]